MQQERIEELMKTVIKDPTSFQNINRVHFTGKQVRLLMNLAALEGGREALSLFYSDNKWEVTEEGAAELHQTIDALLTQIKLTQEAYAH
jgi:hypothetical protein